MGTDLPELLTINLETDQVIILHVLTNMTQANMAIYIENYSRSASQYYLQQLQDSSFLAFITFIMFIKFSHHIAAEYSSSANSVLKNR